jgi:electron-transferring-flavoprotein dehydrogenase
MPASFVPADYQIPLPIDQFLSESKPGEDAVPMDVLFVGGGPAGLAGAIELARLVRNDPSLGSVEIGVLEKSEELGQHCLSGAVVNPIAFRELFPELPDRDFPFRGPVQRERVYLLTERSSIRLPTPPTMKNHGNFVASISEIVRWLGAKATDFGVNLFTGFPADELLVDGSSVIGVRTVPSGLTRDGKPGSAYAPATEVTAKVTVLSEGTRGPLGQAYLASQKIRSPNPQIFALGVKEIWEVKRPLDTVVHTLGWPLSRTAFGGSFFYPLAPDLVALGIVVGLDYRESSLDVHALLQKLKEHFLFRRYLEGGEMVEWGAKTIPEGGYWSLPERLSGDGILLVGDTAGLVDVPSLKGIHYAMKSGMLAAAAIYQALKSGDVSASTLGAYDTALRKSFIWSDLHRTRNMRLAFKSGFYAGGAKSAFMTVSGALFGSRIPVEEDARERKTVTPPMALRADGSLTFGKLDSVFRSGNNTRDDAPSHLLWKNELPPEVQSFYAAMCPAGVYEQRDGQFVVNASNCVDCKAADVLGPRWRPREGGAGTKYKRM